jgi:hypothetical protein
MLQNQSVYKKSGSVNRPKIQGKLSYILCLWQHQKRMRWDGHVARMGEGRGVHRVLVGKSEGKRPLGRPRRRWEDNIKRDI